MLINLYHSYHLYEMILLTPKTILLKKAAKKSCLFNRYLPLSAFEMQPVHESGLLGSL